MQSKNNASLRSLLSLLVCAVKLTLSPLLSQ